MTIIMAGRKPIVISICVSIIISTKLVASHLEDLVLGRELLLESATTRSTKVVVVSHQLAIGKSVKGWTAEPTAPTTLHTILVFIC